MEKINIGFTVDNNYVKYLAVTIVSILKNTKSNIDIYILNAGDISEKNKQKINKLKAIKDFNIKWITVDTKLFEGQGTNVREDVTIATNYRFSLPSLLPDLDKIIFLDADLILVDDIEKLWEINVNEYYMGARPNSQALDYLNSIGIKSGNKYYNTGVMLCNLAMWRNNNIEQIFFENAKKYKNVCLFLDQDILVTTLQDKIYDLQLYWNNLSYKNEFSEQTKICHWASENKPWNNADVPYFDVYENYAKLTPFYKEIYYNIEKQKKEKIAKERADKISSLMKRIFSIHNVYRKNKKTKWLYLLGIKMKLYSKTI